MANIEIISKNPSPFYAARLEHSLPRARRMSLQKISFWISAVGLMGFLLLEILSYGSQLTGVYLQFSLGPISQKLFGVSLLAFPIFWVLWIIDFYFLCESRPVPFLSKKEGAAEKVYWLDFGGARRAWYLGLPNAQQTDISALYYLFGPPRLGEAGASTSSALLPLRLGIDPGKFANFIRERASSEKTVVLSQKDLIEKLIAGADKSDSLTIGAREFMMVLHGADENFSKFLFDNNIRDKELRGAMEWIASYLEASRISSRWWDRSNLGRIPGVGKSLGFGFTYTLDGYSRDVSLSESSGNRVQAHKKVIDAIEETLARSREANVLLVGEEGVGKQTILSSLARMIWEGKIMPELEHKRMVLLDTASITASLKNKSDIEALIIKIMNEAVSAGNIILVIDNFADFLASMAGIGIEAISLLEPYLTSARIQVIALSDPANFHRNLEQNGKVAKLFQKVEVLEPTESELIRVLENAAEILERRTGVIATYDLADRFIPDGAMPEKAIDLLDQAMSGSKGRGSFLLPGDLERIIQTRTNIPTEAVGEDESKKLLELENILHKRIVGQEAAVKGVADAMRRLRAGLHEGKRPIGSFLFLGPTGVGKTETANALAEAYFGSEKNMTRFDMSEYHGDDGIKKLIGSFEGREPGLLANALREKPFCVLLFDEFEKASREVVNLFLQILDEGFFTDANGKKVSSRDAIIIATSNSGSNLIWDILKTGRDPSQVKDDVIDSVRKDGTSSPELLNRFDDIVIFHPLGPEHLKAVAKMLLEDFAKKLKEKDITFVITDELADAVAEMGYEPLLGARPMRRVITDKVEQAVAKKILEKKLVRGGTFELSVDDLKNIK